ncbi:hypothetical protein CTAYLR_003975 [Chrysophaeum taylorii]|uniref:Elongation factor Ts, mitochondrial n=1 Tax=Chrysophaeum taylorii TaxID=2483200 RepID=A0AAD7UDX0_9STRA|nr:hypothetical protein CTAYLR_003975 [Chrysophaeum taylorii]
MTKVFAVLAAASPASAFLLGGGQPQRSYVALHATTTFSAADVKALRQASGAGMMDCKKALVEAEGDMEKASEWLRVKGLASAAKKGERATKEGLVETYVHTGGKLGVMVEVNCETDFVSKGPDFKEMCRLVAMQVAACPGVEYVKFEDIPAALIDEERSVESRSEDLASKPTEIRAKIVEGRVTKMFNEKVLLSQAYIKDPKLTVDEFVKSYVAKLGENMQITRFVKFELGKGDEPADNKSDENLSFGGELDGVVKAAVQSAGARWPEGMVDTAASTVSAFLTAEGWTLGDLADPEIFDGPAMEDLQNDIKAKTTDAIGAARANQLSKELKLKFQPSA